MVGGRDQRGAGHRWRTLQQPNEHHRRDVAGVADAEGAPARSDRAPGSDVLAMATVNGADAVGMGDELGRLEPGFLADLTIVDTRTANMAPVHDPTLPSSRR